MTLIDRYILGRLLTNFLILFTLLFLFAAAIDLILALDKFLDVAREITGPVAGFGSRAAVFARLAVDFQGPRFFQFYGYLHGLVAVGAMGFTLAQMYRHRELVAILASGVSMHRIAMPFVVGMFLLSALQLLNQELILPRVAPLLLRDHGDIGRASVTRYPFRFTPDGHDNLIQSPSFDPIHGSLEHPTILERDDAGRTVRRITATFASWTEEGEAGWRLTEGEAVVLRGEGTGIDQSGRVRMPLAFYPTDLSRVLVVRRYGEYAAMLSLVQIGGMLEAPGVRDQPRLVASLLRHRYVRFSSVLVNILVMWMTLPAFLIRQPANLLLRTVMCAGFAIPAMLGSAIFMLVDLPGISPAVGVFLPVIVLIPVVLAEWTFVKT